MIFDELNTGFRWYDALDKQTRYKEQCATMCDYALMAPCNDMLPFQIRTPSFGDITSWKLIYLDGTIEIPAIPSRYNYSTAAWTETGYSFNLTLFLNFSISGSSSFSSLGKLTILDAINDIVSQINSVSGKSLASYVGRDFLLISPTGGISANTNAAYWVGTGTGAPTISPSSPSFFSGGLDESTGTEFDIVECSININRYVADSNDYLQYNGESLQGCLPKQLDCGKWYSTITDGTTTLYSEVFEVMQFDDLSFEQMKLPLFTAWRFYDSKDKQTRYKEYCQTDCNFYLIVQNTALLPFQIKTNEGTTGIETFKLVGIDEDCEVLLDTTLVSIVTTGDGDRLVYNGDAISNLICGKFYAVLFDGVTTWYSELIEVVANIEDFDYLQTDDGVNITTDGGDYITID